MFNVDLVYSSLSDYLYEIKELIHFEAEWRWIVAEVAKINIDRNNRCWIELVEKKDDIIVAQSSAVVWESNIETVYNFHIKTGLELQAGIKILFYGKGTFHERYGFRIQINQIDPSYTLGEMALRKKEILERLTKEGLIDKNKLLPIPKIIQRIAVVSSQSAAGYEDFLKILKGNSSGYKFKIHFFDVFVQGDLAVPSIVKALKKCAENHNNFDVVVIIRGGGAVVDLQCFNEYEIAKAIALMPIPVLTGIGHTRDETVADHVAHSRFKTPSEVAKFILDLAVFFEGEIENLFKAIYHKAEIILKDEKSKTKNYEEKLKKSVESLLKEINSNIKLSLNKLGTKVFSKINAERDKISIAKHLFQKNTNLCIKKEAIRINSSYNKIISSTSKFFVRAHSELKSNFKTLSHKSKSIILLNNMKLSGYDDKLRILSPENTLKRGYSITYLNGRVLKDSREVSTGDKLEIRLYKGKILSEVQKKEDEDGESKLF